MYWGYCKDAYKNSHIVDHIVRSEEVWIDCLDTVLHDSTQRIHQYTYAYLFQFLTPIVANPGRREGLGHKQSTIIELNFSE
jgi:hypothetical protein